MPELPEVETMRRGILKSVGHRIIAIEKPPCPRKPILLEPSLATFRKRAVGQQITAIDRLGKRVVMRLANGDSIVFEPRMTGLVLVSDPPTIEHLRFRLALRGGRDPRHLVLGPTRPRLSALAQRKNVPKSSGRGSSWPRCLSRLGRPTSHSLPPKQSADQSGAARSKSSRGVVISTRRKSLHLAQIHPAHRCDRLTADQ